MIGPKEDIENNETSTHHQLMSPPLELKTPLPSRFPSSRMGNQDIDIDLLISKLLEIPNEDILNTLLNLSERKEDYI